ncbi:GAF and ANTAR domain-containing protein [Streptomyces sp. NPDC018019]|uniref:GAF and ANTAR domain-containing protein n=1 Tax=Streptomyces sp. NPDC018019 TaxID=3365030 RepID=UPI003796B784
MHDDDQAAAWRRITATAGGDITLATACRACAEDLNADCLGITLVAADDLRLLGYAGDERAELMEDAQLVSGEGPCTEAYVTGALVEEADLHQAFERWPAFSQAAAEQHVRSVTALPLTIGALRCGAVDLYRTTPGLLSPRHKARARAYARILALLTLDEHPHLLTAEPRRSRTGPQGYPANVHVAAGILAEKHRLSTDDALARLRAHAFRHNQPLQQAADHVLSNHSLD